MSKDELSELVRGAAEDLELSLHGFLVLTEAATGSFASTAVLSALAGADVYAVAASSDWGSAADAERDVRALARACDVHVMVGGLQQSPWGEADLITNSRPLRPFDAVRARDLKPGAVVSLMFEAWELRPNEVDVSALTKRGVRVVGVDEHHPLVDVFGKTGQIAVKQLRKLGVTLEGGVFGVVGDDEFRPVVEQALRDAGGTAHGFETLAGAVSMTGLGALIQTSISIDDAKVEDEVWRSLARRSPDVVFVQFCGGVDIRGAKRAGIAVFPARQVPGRIMAWTLASLGAEPVVRLMAGGLRAGQEALRGEDFLLGQPVSP